VLAAIPRAGGWVVRPELVRYNGLLACNWAACLAFDAFVWRAYGAWTIIYPARRGAT